MSPCFQATKFYGEQMAANSVIRVVDAFPELVGNLDGERADLARRHALATLEVLTPGNWQPDVQIQRAPGHLGLLVIDGLLTRDVALGNTVATENVGRRDILPP